MNSCTFTGRLAADAKADTTPNGTAILKFRLASDTGYGERKKTHWLNCAMFGERGTKLAGYLRKGQAVTVICEIDPPREYEANGERRIAQDAVVRDIALQGRRDDEQGQGQGQYSGAPGNGSHGTTGEASPHQASYHAQAPASKGEFEDDIPF